MKELAKEYKQSLSMLNERIHELVTLKIKLQETSEDPEHDPDIIDLNDRLKHLKSMQIDTREVTKEVEHYYDKHWWRSPEYTLNSVKSRKFIYVRSSRR